MGFYIEEHTKYNVELDEDGYRAFEDVDDILTNLIGGMEEKNCRTVSCFDAVHIPVNYDIDEIIEFRTKLLELQEIFEIST